MSNRIILGIKDPDFSQTPYPAPKHQQEILDICRFIHCLNDPKITLREYSSMLDKGPDLLFLDSFYRWRAVEHTTYAPDQVPPETKGGVPSKRKEEFQQKLAEKVALSSFITPIKFM